MEILKCAKFVFWFRSFFTYDCTDCDGRINNLLMTLNKHGVTDNQSLLAPYKSLNKIIEKKDTTQLIVIVVHIGVTNNCNSLLHRVPLHSLFRNLLFHRVQTLKYWFGVPWGKSFLMGRCLFSLGRQPFQWWCYDILWGRSFTTLASVAPHLFLMSWLKLNLTLLSNQLRWA